MNAKQMNIIYIPQQSSERSPRRAFFPWQRPEYLQGGYPDALLRCSSNWDIIGPIIKNFLALDVSKLTAMVMANSWLDSDIRRLEEGKRQLPRKFPEIFGIP